MEVQFKFAWTIIGHCGVRGNENADYAAKVAVHISPIQNLLVPASDLISILQREILLQWKDEWITSTTKLHYIKTTIGAWQSSSRSSRSGGGHYCPSSSWSF